ncbi:MAG: hypothetical protein A2X94_02830, partial [Bdellovibrionales bacterium GWB1_55_8]
MERVDILILGAGGAGMMCAIQAARRGRDVLLIDHSTKIGGKILISGGGRCNFTNVGAGPANYVSENPHFTKSALSRFPPAAFIEMMRDHEIPFHERKHGQLFCDGSAQAIVDLLKSECDQAGARFRLGYKIERVSRPDRPDSTGFKVDTDHGAFECESLVVATGGLSLPKLGATGIGYDIARQFGLKVTETAPALDGFTFTPEQEVLFRELAGLSVNCSITCNGISFRENLLFTHAGLSGPVALQASLHWKKGDEIKIDLLPGNDLFQWFLAKKKTGNRSVVKNLLGEMLPNRLASRLCDLYFHSLLPLPQVSERELEAFCNLLHAWVLKPSGTVG